MAKCFFSYTFIVELTYFFRLRIFFFASIFAGELTTIQRVIGNAVQFSVKRSNYVKRLPALP
jgi:hypothetical protein